jgi:hypothetical protein
MGDKKPVQGANSMPPFMLDEAGNAVKRTLVGSTQLGEPFLLLGQIESHVRNLIANKYTLTELATTRDPSHSDREVEDVVDLTLSLYIRLLENPKLWERLGLTIDRKVVWKN